MEDADKKLTQARDDYEAGNFKRGIATARQVEEKGEESSKVEARKLLTAMGIDPVATLVFGVTGFVMLFLVIKFLLAGD